MWETTGQSMFGRQEAAEVHKEGRCVVTATVQQESLIPSMAIDVREKRNISISDIVGAHLLAYMNDYILIRLTGERVNTLSGISSRCSKCVTKEGEQGSVPQAKERVILAHAVSHTMI